MLYGPAPAETTIINIAAHQCTLAALREDGRTDIEVSQRAPDRGVMGRPLR